jgi:hypothetical protein
MQSAPITTDVVSLNPAQGKVYNIMLYTLSVTCGRSVVFSTNKTDRHDINEILLKVALNTIKSTKPVKLSQMKGQGVLLQMLNYIVHVS